MRNFTRLSAPVFLTPEKEKQYGEQYQKKREKNSGAKFSWYQHEGKKINHLFLPILKEQTQNHCSYCDHAPPRLGDDTIDHFKPKSRPEFYLDVCKWENLYIACNRCQDAKREEFNELLLRPDEINYHFNTFFIYNFNEHLISVNPRASELDKTRAAITLQIFKFNEDAGLITSREREFERYTSRVNNGISIDLNDFAYRFMIE